MNNLFRQQNNSPTNSFEKPGSIEPENFPELLKQIVDPPQQLYYVGNISLLYPDQTASKTFLNEKSPLRYISIVGSRKYSDYGKMVCESLIAGLQGLPVVIISGLALGIDSIAHRAALKYKIPTVAVPGSGLHPSVIYPRTHFSLAEEIISSGGLLISEFEPRAPASPWSFPIRNRIMAGLSHAVLIIEAEEDSGTLITARLALDYNRDVLTIPASIYSSTSKGPHKLIKSGAVVITSAEDLRAYLGFSTTSNTACESSSPTHIYVSCSKEEQDILELLKEPRTKDELCHLSGKSITEIHIIISMLEIRNIIEERYGKIYLK